MPSASLVPATFDPSVLLTTAGMQPFKPYFLGQEQPPHAAADDLPEVLPHDRHRQRRQHARHLTFFEMLGNFSIGDYFKQGAIEFAWELSTQGFGFDPEDVWVTVFGGDEELGLGPGRGGDRAAGRRSASRDERIVELPALGELLAGRPDRAVRAVLRAVPRPRPRLRHARTTCPGDENERFLEFWNLVFMQFELQDGQHAHRRCRSRTSTPASGSTAWRRSCRTWRPSSRPTSSSR